MVVFIVDFLLYTVGTSDILHSFFSTVAYNLEDNRWGSKFPLIMNELYQGEISAEKIDKATLEVMEIKSQLKNLSADKVVWDIENLSLQPPQEYEINKDAVDLSNYFRTSEGENLIEVLLLALEHANELGLSIRIEAL